MTVALVIIAFCVSGMYMILGARAAIRLSKHLGYKRGFLKLWNETQYSVMSVGELTYTLDDEEAKILFANLRKIIIRFYLLFLPTIFIAFIAQFLGY